MKSRIVIKVGTSLLNDGGKIHNEAIAKIAKCIATLRNHFEVILVTSGAVATGYTQLQLDRANPIFKQALASLGQPLLFEVYREVFAPLNILISQILLSQSDFGIHNTKKMIETLLAHQVLPIINENDAVADRGFGDNDRLSAFVAYHFGASLLVILSDIDGWFDQDPHHHLDAKLILKASSIPSHHLNAEYNPYSHFSTGGIVTKLIAADFLLQKQRAMFLCNGNKLEDLESFLLHKIQKSGTLFGEFQWQK